MTRAQAGQLLALLTAAHPRTKIEDATVDLWLDELSRLDHEVGAVAVRALVEAVKGWPTIAHLHEQIAAAREQAIRERRDQERREAQDAFDRMPRPPLREIPAAVALLERFSLKPIDAERVEDGPCDDGCGRSEARYRVGRFNVCGSCARLRARAATRLGDDHPDDNAAANERQERSTR